EALRKLLRQNDVRGNLAHHVDLQPLAAALKTMLGHHRQHAVCLRWGPAEGDHNDDVREADFLTYLPQGTALKGEALLVAIAVVPGCPAEAEHRILLPRLERSAANQVGVFVRLEVAETDDYVVRRHGGRRR